MGSGFRTFQSGEVLTASNVQNYLMEQSVMTFAGTAALGSAIGTAVEAGMVAYLTDSDQIIHYRADAVQGTAWQAMPMVGGAANVVINGAMQVAQRGTSTASITGGGYYTGDRWNTGLVTLGTWTQSIENDAPTGSGFRKSLKMLCTTADASPAAGDLAQFGQLIEGQNLQQFLKGTASAKQFTLSFWVKSNKTGTYVAYLFDADNSRMANAQYTISASGTWEKKTITFPADTTGAFDNDNGNSLGVRFGLAAGTDWTSGSLQTTWASLTNANLLVGQTNLAAATNNYWQITGVQLEAGSVATPFEFEDYGTTLAKCQRYYWRESGEGPVICNMAYYTSTSAYGVLATKVPMRTQPTLIQSTGTNYYTMLSNNVADGFDSIAAISDVSNNAVRIDVTSGISGTAGHAAWLRSANASSSIALSAEL